MQTGWHACWWKKYLTLLYYFNALPATVSVTWLIRLWMHRFFGVPDAGVAIAEAQSISMGTTSLGVHKNLPVRRLLSFHCFALGMRHMRRLFIYIGLKAEALSIRGRPLQKFSRPPGSRSFLVLNVVEPSKDHCCVRSGHLRRMELQRVRRKGFANLHLR